MLRPALALALLLLATAPPPAQAAWCDPTQQACTDGDETGSCRSVGNGWNEARFRNVMLGAPLVASWRASYTCASSARTDAWETNVTYGKDGLRTRWESQPGRDQSMLRADLTGPQTNTTTYWMDRDGECTLWTLGTLLGASVNDRRACPAGPPHVPQNGASLLP